MAAALRTPPQYENCERIVINRRELLGAIAAAPGLSAVKLSEIPDGGEPLLFVLECDFLMTDVAHVNIARAWESAVKGKPASEIPFVILDSDMKLKLIRKSDIEAIEHA